MDVAIYEKLGLDAAAYGKIEKILRREPTPTELAMFSVEWSEHCGYPSSRALLKGLPRTGKYEVVASDDSAGVVVGDDVIIFKIESHNHPSQIEPTQGAATGVGGIIRDIFTAGARPVALLDSLRFGNLDDAYNRFLLKRVVEGIAYYGNCVGVPTIGGEVACDPCYTGNCLVNAMCIGIAKKGTVARARASGEGNAIMYVGASTGRDGIGGCSVLASQEFKESEEKRPAVQIGDPFTEKCLIEATLEALATGYIVGIKDMGAAGLTCSTSEMAAEGGAGMEIELDRVPAREEGMEPWEIMMSESQERMLACVEKGQEKEIEKIFFKWGLNAVVIGRVTSGNNITIFHNGVRVADIHAKALTEPPLRELPAREPAARARELAFRVASVGDCENAGEVLTRLLSSPSLASPHWIYEQYDHMVQTNTVVMPGSDAAVIRLKGTGKYLAATTDCNSTYCYLNPREGARGAVAEAARNLVCAGADPAAVTDCLNFGNPEKPDRYWQFTECVKGMSEACEAFEVPVVSGNVSFYNENPRGAIYPTPTIGMVGIVHDAAHVMTYYFKGSGHAVLLLGDARGDLGASAYLKLIHDKVAGDAPKVDFKKERALHDTIRALNRKGFLYSCHDCAEGGVATALAESCIGGPRVMGVTADCKGPGRKDELLFGEAHARVIISCDKERVRDVEGEASRYGVPVAAIGTTGGSAYALRVNGIPCVTVPCDRLLAAWRSSLENILAKK